MILVKAIDGSGETETRAYVEDALYLAALKAHETKKTHGLFCMDKEKPFASVGKGLWKYIGRESL